VVGRENQKKKKRDGASGQARAWGEKRYEIRSAGCERKSFRTKPALQGGERRDRDKASRLDEGGARTDGKGERSVELPTSPE